MSYKGKYDPSEYVVTPQLGKGHSEKVQLYVQSGHVRALNVLARSGIFPFDQANDVVRWAIKFGLEELDRREPTLINSVMKRANLLLAIGKEDTERRIFLKSFDTLREATSAHLGRNDRAMARDLVLTYRKIINQMPDEPVRELRWKLKYLDELDLFKHLEDEE